MSGHLHFPDSWPVLRDFVLFLAGNSFFKVCLTLIVSRRGWKKNVCSGRSLDMFTKLRPARFFFRQNKYLIKNIKIFRYINSKYMCPPIFWALKKSMWDLHYFERNWRKVEKVVEFRTFYGTCHSHKQCWEEKPAFIRIIQHTYLSAYRYHIYMIVYIAEGR
jgi:hypothetical protein